MKRWIATAACCAATAAAAQSEPVRVVKDYAQVAACQRLGEVRGQTVMGGILFQSGNYDRVLGEMKEKVAATGGNHLLLMDISAGFSGGEGLGEAYRCDPPGEAGKARRKR